MANKKCPKCGEDNPAEAVMCWACYTPLTAGAGASMGAGARGGATTFPQSGALPGGMGAGAAPADERDKKKIDPRLFFVGGGLAVAAVIFALTTGAFGGGGGGDGNIGGVPTDNSATMNSSSSSGSGMTTGSGFVPPSPPQPPSGPTQSQLPPQQAPYSMIVPPNPRNATATMAIVPGPGQSGSGAGLAKQARQNLQRTGKWTKFQIAVYSDANSPGATAFKQYVNDHRGAPLGPQDFNILGNQNAWTGATAFYEASSNGGERVSNPSANPTSWWSGSR